MTTRSRGSDLRTVALAVAVVALGLGSCADGGAGPDASGGAGSAGADDPAATADPAASAECACSEPDLRVELLEMSADDQAERTGAKEWTDETDQARTDRLGKIIDDHGWPTTDLVGADGAGAAWLVAQHSDLDIAFQQRALELMRPAVDAGLADPTELAFLEDRVAVNTGREQRYGSQIRCEAGVVTFATPIEEPDGLDGRRADVGLEPIADYLALFEEDCAASQSEVDG